MVRHRKFCLRAVRKAGRSGPNAPRRVDPSTSGISTWSALGTTSPEACFWSLCSSNCFNQFASCVGDWFRHVQFAWVHVQFASCVVDINFHWFRPIRSGSIQISPISSTVDQFTNFRECSILIRATDFRYQLLSSDYLVLIILFCYLRPLPHDFLYV